MRLLMVTAAALCATTAGCTDMSSPVEPGCKNPAPLMGEPSPRGMLGYVVTFHDGVDTLEETVRLKRIYRIEPTYVSTFIPVFFANFDDDVRERLRCEPTVQSIAYDAPGTPPP